MFAHWIRYSILFSLFFSFFRGLLRPRARVHAGSAAAWQILEVRRSKLDDGLQLFWRVQGDKINPHFHFFEILWRFLV